MEAIFNRTGIKIYSRNYILVAVSMNSKHFENIFYKQNHFNVYYICIDYNIQNVFQFEDLPHNSAKAKIV